MLDIFLRGRWFFLAGFIALVFSVSGGLKTAMVPDNALTVWFLQSDPKLKEYHRFHEQFGNDEVILLEVERTDSIFTHETLTTLRELGTELEKIPGVERVNSLVTLDDAFQRDDALVFEPAIPTPVPSDPAVLTKYKDQLTQNMMFADRLISRDGKRAMLWIQMEVMGDIDAKRDSIVAKVSATADRVLGDTPHPMGGIGVIYSGLNVVTQADAGKFIPISYLLIFFILWWIFRSMRLVLAAMGVVTLASMATLGIYGLMGHQINTVTVVLPNLILVIGLADAIHFPAAFSQELDAANGRSHFEIVKATIARVFVPCLFTTATTMIGFLALATSPMGVIRQLGIYGAMGIGLALFASICLLAVTFFTMKDYRPVEQHRWIQQGIEKTQQLLLKRPREMTLLSIGVVVIFALGATKVRSDTDAIGYLPDENRVVQDHRQLEGGWGFYTPMEFILTPREGYTANHPDILNGIDTFIKKASQIEAVRDGFGLSIVYRRMAEVLGADPKLIKEPLSAPMVAQLGLILEMQDYEWERGADEFHKNILAPFQSEEAELGRLSLITQNLSANGYSELFESLEPIAEESFAGIADLKVAGYLPLYVTIIDYVLQSQISSFYLAISLIFMLMLVWLRSLRLAIISLVPNVFPVLVMMGAMGFLEIRLDLGTATVAAIVLGIAIDDTVHFLHYWRQAEREQLPWEQALAFTFARAGEPAAVTTILLMLGFPVLMLADAQTVVYFGLLTTIAAAAALFADAIILPLLLKQFPSSKQAKESP